MQPSSFSKQFTSLVLERIEHVRVESKKNHEITHHQWLQDLETIQTLLPDDKKHLVENIRESFYKFSDEYDEKIYKIGFADGFSLFQEMKNLK